MTREGGVPIDGVGFQGHVTTATPLGSLTATMDRFTDLGLFTRVTEADVRLDDAGSAVLQEQALVCARARFESGTSVKRTEHRSPVALNRLYPRLPERSSSHV